MESYSIEYVNMSWRLYRHDMLDILMRAGQFAHVSSKEFEKLLTDIDDAPSGLSKEECSYSYIEPNKGEIVSIREAIYHRRRIPFAACRDFAVPIRTPDGEIITCRTFRPDGVMKLAEARFGCLCQICMNNTAELFLFPHWGHTFIGIGSHLISCDQNATHCKDCAILALKHLKHVKASAGRGVKTPRYYVDGEDFLTEAIIREMSKKNSPLIQRVAQSSHLTFRFDPRASVTSGDGIGTTTSASYAAGRW